MIVNGKMQYLYDEKGTRYLDVRTLPTSPAGHIQAYMLCELLTRFYIDPS
jgi:acetylornithine/succinyldiaminopimelate/putrescine aminotransferase